LNLPDAAKAQARCVRQVRQPFLSDKLLWRAEKGSCDGHGDSATLVVFTPAPFVLPSAELYETM
jgi:hypothetical protein